MMYKTLTLALGLVSTSGLFYSDSADHQLFMWNQFKQEYGREYDAAEDASRFKVFVQNLKTIDARNALEKERVHGITKFSDLTQEEFENSFLGAKPELRTDEGEYVNHVEYTGSQSSVDWSGVYTTPVKDQGYCGSCWAFSATEQIESDSMRVLKTSYILSPEQVTQCTKTSSGCNGGWTESAYNYVKGEGGLETNSDYPYTSYYGKTGTCSAVKSKEVIGITGYTTINGETNMANYVLSTGPLSVCVDASSWNSYTGGIMTKCGNRVDHCVQAVGVNTGANGYWKVRNSWGTSWGESGYIRLAYGQNTCDITNDPTYVAPVKA